MNIKHFILFLFIVPSFVILSCKDDTVNNPPVNTSDTIVYKDSISLWMPVGGPSNLQQNFLILDKYIVKSSSWNISFKLETDSVFILDSVLHQFSLNVFYPNYNLFFIIDSTIHKPHCLSYNFNLQVNLNDTLSCSYSILLAGLAGKHTNKPSFIRFSEILIKNN